MHLIVNIEHFKDIYLHGLISHEVHFALEAIQVPKNNSITNYSWRKVRVFIESYFPPSKKKYGRKLVYTVPSKQLYTGFNSDDNNLNALVFSVDLQIKMLSPRVSTPLRPALPTICLYINGSIDFPWKFRDITITRRAGKFTPTTWQKNHIVNRFCINTQFEKSF